MLGLTTMLNKSGLPITDNIDVSIIIPVFNAADSIGDLIGEICREKRVNFELIVINDGSSDNTRDIIAAIADPRVVVIDQVNKGVYAARNAGLAVHRGKWLMFLDADDRVGEGFIYNRLMLAEENHIDVLVMNAWRDGFGHEHKVAIHQKQSCNKVISGFSWMRSCVDNDEWPHYLWLQLVRSDYVKRHRMTFHEGKSHKDILWTVELAINNGNFYISDEKDYTYLHNAQSITNRGDYFDLRATSYIDVIKKLINYSRKPGYESVRICLLRHALVETRHFLGLYRNRVRDKDKVKRNFKGNISLSRLGKGINSPSDFFFYIKLVLKLR
ncbi:glycosyltransferase [Erwinia billingiae]|uniref:glycosyltransferase n=1 Tax=Erwinia billingiae TaxID=182337 RepID=UPI001CD96994|nr:glycosyltransferase [Erwinia billingiae]